MTLHGIAHLFGLARGRIYSWTDDDGQRMVGRRCAACGQITGAQPFRFLARPPQSPDPEESAWEEQG